MTYSCCPLVTSLVSTFVVLMCSAIGLGVGGRSLYCYRGGSLKGGNGRSNEANTCREGEGLF